jgi:hypothetical protein
MQSSQRNDMQTPLNAESGIIAIHLRDLSQLLQIDPSPFRESALTPEAEDYILRKAKRLPGHQPIHVVIGLPPGASRLESTPDIRGAITGHFRGRAEMEAEDLRELFRYGRKALLIGFVTLSACLFLAWYVSYNLPTRPVTRLMQESFVILGWVSMWRPIEIFLYDWLPLARRKRLFLRLSQAAVTVESD